MALEQAAALGRFFARLDTLDDGRGTRPVRIAVYGSSSTASDRYTGYLRGFLQARFGDGGPGFVALVPLWRWHRHTEVAPRASRSWTITHVAKGKPDGRDGLMGVSATTRSPHATLQVEPHDRAPGTGADRLELFYLRQPGGGSFELTWGDRTERIDTDAPESATGHHRIEHAVDPWSLEIRDVRDGPVRLFGAAIERDPPATDTEQPGGPKVTHGVVLDELGIGGTRATDLLRLDEPIWAAGLKARDPALVVLAYGGNESRDETLPLSDYGAGLDQVLTRIRRAVPEADCLIVGPGDIPMKVAPGRYRPNPRLDPLIQLQREASRRHHCAYWDTRAFMGGPDSMETWVAAELAMRDRIHFRPEGYTRMGRALAEALMDAYVDRPLRAGRRDPLPR